MARQIIFASALPEDESCDARSLDSENENSTDTITESIESISEATPAITSSMHMEGTAELQISGLDSVCNGRDNAYIPYNLASLLGLSLVSSVVKTANTTTTLVLTSTLTNTFTILGCSPSSLPYNTC